MNTVSRHAIRIVALALLFAAAAAVESTALPGAEGAAAPPAAGPAPEAAQPVPEPVEAAPAPPADTPPPSLTATPDQLQAEVCALRDDMRMLQSTLDLMVNKIMADLREENEQLRLEIRRLNALRGMPDMAGINAVPRPAGSVIDEVLSEPEPAPELPPPPPFKFTIVREWGRTAEEAQSLGGEAQSLKGVIGVVPGGSLRQDIEKLARDLRKRYDGFDNINIEVFDDPVVAREFAGNKAADPEHRVLSVSRHKASGRDAIVLLANGKGEMISADPNAPPPQQQPDDLPTLSVTNPVSPGQADQPDAANEPVEEAAPAVQDLDPAPAQEEAPVPGQWQKSKKKAPSKGASGSGRDAEEAAPEPPLSQRPIPEGTPVLVPHEPAPPETTVIVAPPGEPVPMDQAAPDGEDAASETDGQEESDAPKRGPKSNFGPKSKKGGSR